MLRHLSLWIIEMSAELEKIDIPTFIEMPRAAQQIFLEKINISSLKSNRPLLQKFVGLKVLMEARAAAENQSSFNLTAQFRNFLAFFGLNEMKLGADRGSSDIRTEYQDEIRTGDIATNGYRLFHISKIGHHIWTRKSFNIGLDQHNNILTQKVQINGRIRASSKVEIEDMKTWESLNRAHLRAVFAAIQEESSYENSFGYDLLCAAMYSANQLFNLPAAVINRANQLFNLTGTRAIGLSVVFGLLLLPFILALNLAIYAVALPTAFTFIALEYCIIEPIKWVLSATSTPEQYEAFIAEVTSGLEDDIQILSK